MPDDTATMNVFMSWFLSGGGGATHSSNSAQKGIDPMVISRTHVGASCKIGDSIWGIHE